MKAQSLTGFRRPAQQSTVSGLHRASPQFGLRTTCWPAPRPPSMAGLARGSGTSRPAGAGSLASGLWRWAPLRFAPRCQRVHGPRHRALRALGGLCARRPRTSAPLASPRPALPVHGRAGSRAAAVHGGGLGASASLPLWCRAAASPSGRAPTVRLRCPGAPSRKGQAAWHKRAPSPEDRGPLPFIPRGAPSAEPPGSPLDGTLPPLKGQ
jgi:hypothetical protein